MSIKTNKFVYGLICGFFAYALVAMGYRFLTNSDFETQSTPPKDNTAVVDLTYPILDTSKPTKSSSPKVDPKLTEQAKDAPRFVNEEYIELESKSQNTDLLPNESLNRIVKKLETLDQSELKRLSNIIDNLSVPSILDSFSTEPVDIVWAEQKQVALEYGFYTESGLRNIGEIDSISCKSKHCLVKIQVPAELEMKSSYYMDWSDPVAVNLTPSLDGDDYRTVEIHISRKSSN